jgi:RNA-binding protein YlmH
MLFVSGDYVARLQNGSDKKAEGHIDWDSIDWEKDDWWQDMPGEERSAQEDGELSQDALYAPAGMEVLCVSVPKGAEMPGHRDFLGTVLALGLDRRALGDIVPYGDKTYLFVKKSVSEYLIQNMIRVGKSPVLTKRTTLPSDFAPERAFEESVLTLASLRVDALVAAITGLSREEAKNAVIRGTVSRNHLPLTQPEALLNEGDVLSVKGFGRYRLKASLGLTKKGRLKIVLQKYV